MFVFDGKDLETTYDESRAINPMVLGALVTRNNFLRLGLNKSKMSEFS